jgi:hypothetical protein
MARKFLFLFVILALVWFVNAQVPVVARFTSDNPTRLVGEKVNLTLVVEVPADAVVTFPEFPTDWPPFEVQSVGEINRTVSGDTAIYRQTLTVIAWRPGDHPTPETFVQYQLTPDGEAFSIAAEPTVITVPSVLVSGDANLRPLKPPASLPYLPPWLILIAAVALIGIARAVVWWRARGGSVQRLFTLGRAGTMAYSPKQRALLQLQNIREGKLSPMIVYATVADCLRTYIQRQFNVSALDMTTNELMTTLQTQKTIPTPLQRDLARMLEYADLVKFAHVQPGERAVKQLLETAEKWVEAVEPAVNGDEAIE